MKYQALFYHKNNEKYSRLSSAAVVIGAVIGAPVAPKVMPWPADLAVLGLRPC